MHRREAESHVSRLERENRELRARLAQFEEHRNKPLLRDLNIVLDALENIGTYGWPKQDEGRGGKAHGGGMGDQAAISRLVGAEGRLRRLIDANNVWLENREDEKLRGLSHATT